MDESLIISEESQAALRDAKLEELRISGDYRSAIAQACKHPEAMFSYPLLMAALDKARNVRVIEYGFEGSMADTLALFPALRSIMTQPYAKKVLDRLIAWAPSPILANADSFTDQPYATEIISKAFRSVMKNRPETTYLQLPPIEYLRALNTLSNDQLKNSLKNPSFSQDMAHYHSLHTRFCTSKPHEMPRESKEIFAGLERAFTIAKQRPLKPSSEGFEPASILVLSSPSGGGKTTQRRFLLADNPNREFLVSYTTRLPRPGEVDGLDYHFLRIGRTEAEARAEFQRLVDAGEIFEQTDFYGNLYGTPRKQLVDGLAAGKQLIADVNLEGFNAFKATHDNKARGVFLMPPSLEILRARLNERIERLPRLSPEQRQQLESERDVRMEQAQEIIKEAIFYGSAIDQTDCSPLQTYRLVKAAISSPANEVNGFSIVHFGKRDKVSNNGMVY